MTENTELEKLREAAMKARRLAAASTDPLTRQRLVEYAEEYETAAARLQEQSDR